jgi:hypothetical protein
MDNLQKLIIESLGLEVGDIVKITHKADHGDLGWEANWVGWMDECVGMTGKIIMPINKTNPEFGVRVKMDHDGEVWNFPAQCIKLITKKPKSVLLRLNSEYKAEITKDGIIVGCQKFPLSIIDKLVAARDKVLK